MSARSLTSSSEAGRQAPAHGPACGERKQQLLEAAQREAIGHAGDVVGHARGEVERRIAVAHVLGVLAEVREQAAHDESGAIGLRSQRPCP